MPVSNNNLYFYLTGADPFGSITDTSQSIGGYPVTIYAPNTTLLGDITINTNSSFAIIPNNTGYILVDNEIIYTNFSSSTSIRESLATNAQCHTVGSPVSILNNSVFNNFLSNSLQQYRCIAVKNTHTSASFKNLSFYIKYNSLTPNTNIDIAIETPSTDLFYGTADNGTIVTIIDSALTSFIDNFFTQCVVKITSGNNINQSRIVISSDQSTGTLVLDSALPFSTASGDTYTINQKPSQRLETGIITPSGSLISTFQSANTYENALSININGNRTNGNNLVANEVVYLWFRRTRVNNSEETLNNRIVISARYRTV